MAASEAAAASAEYDFSGERQGYWRRAWRRFFRHRLAGASLVLLGALFVLGLLAHRLAPYPYDAVNIHALGLTMPPLVTLLVAAQYLNVTSVYRIAVLIGCVLWMPIARVARSTCLSLREQEYVEAARALGASDARIIRRHLLPNTIGPVAVVAALMTATALVLEVTIAYLGFGISALVRAQTHTPSIGDVMTGARDEGLFHWWGLFFPGFFLVLLIAPICFLGDGLRDALDPTERRNVRPRKRRTRPTLAARVSSHVPLSEVPWHRLGAAVLFPLRPVSRAGTSTRLALEIVFERRTRRRHRAVWLLGETLLVFGVIAAAAGGIYAWQMSSARSPGA